MFNRKRIFILVVFFSIFIVIKNNNLFVESEVNNNINGGCGFWFTDKNTGTLISRSNYNCDPHTSIDRDENFGTAYLVNTKYVDTVSLRTEDRPWPTADVYQSYPKYEVLTFKYPILLDTIVVDDANSYEMYSNVSFSPEMLLAGESYIYTSPINFSKSLSKGIITNISLDFAMDAGLYNTIPSHEVLVGESLSPNLEKLIVHEYDYEATTQLSIQNSGEVFVSNAINSPYYQNGRNIYVEYGIRGTFILQVTIVNEIKYEVESTYTTGWPKTTHYTYSDDYAVYNSIYSGYRLLNTYYNSDFPFVYVWNESNLSYDLIDEMRKPNRKYVN